MSGWGELMATEQHIPVPGGAKLCLLRGHARAQPLPRLLLRRMRIPRCGASSSAGSGRGEPAGGAPGATIPDQKTTRVPASIRRRERTPGSRRKCGVYWERPRQKARALLPRCVVVVFAHSDINNDRNHAQVPNQLIEHPVTQADLPPPFLERPQGVREDRRGHCWVGSAFAKALLARSGCSGHSF